MSRVRGRPAQHIAIPVFTWVMVELMRDRESEGLRRHSIRAACDNLSKKLAAYRANRVLALLSKMFSLAIRWKWRADNPCRGVERNQEHRHERYLIGPERAALLVAMQEHTAKGKIELQTVRALRLAMLTGARIGEVLSARWDQIDLETGTCSVYVCEFHSACRSLGRHSPHRSIWNE